MPKRTPDLPNLLQFKAVKELKQLAESSEGDCFESAAKVAAAKEQARKRRLKDKSEQAQALNPKNGAACFYKSGSTVACRVLAKEADGYSVLTTIDHLPGKLTTQTEYEIGADVVGIFVCAHQGRLVFRPLFTGHK